MHDSSRPCCGESIYAITSTAHPSLELVGCDMLTGLPPADGSFDIVEKAVWGWASESVDFDAVKCAARAVTLLR